MIRISKTQLLSKLFLLAFIITASSCSSTSPETENPPDDTGEETEETPQPEEEQNSAPLAFDLLEVPDGSEQIGLNPAFEWTAAIDPENETVTYTFFLDTSENPVTQLGVALNETSFSLNTELEFGTTYFWRVDAEDTSGNVTSSGIFSFNTRSIGAFVGQPSFGLRHLSSVLEFNGKLYMVAGFGTVDGSPQQYLDDVWSSEDGEVWTLETDNPGFIARALHPVVAFGGKMFLIGGFRANGPSNDIWSSPDGKNWTMETANAEFPADWGHKVLHFNDKLWLITGGQNSEFNRSVWNSENGINWDLVVEDVGFTVSLEQEAVVFNDQMWVVVNDEVYSSPNGINWTLELEDAPFANVGQSGLSFEEYSLIVSEGKMILLVGQQDTNGSTEIWSSIDGKDWVLEHEETAFPNREDNSFFSFQGKLYVMLGVNDQGFLGDIWTLD